MKNKQQKWWILTSWNDDQIIPAGMKGFGTSYGTHERLGVDHNEIPLFSMWLTCLSGMQHECVGITERERRVAAASISAQRRTGCWMARQKEKNHKNSWKVEKEREISEQDVPRGQNTITECWLLHRSTNLNAKPWSTRDRQEQNPLKFARGERKSQRHATTCCGDTSGVL